MIETTLPITGIELGRFPEVELKLTPQEIHQRIASAVIHCENCKRATHLLVDY